MTQASQREKHHKRDLSALSLAHLENLVNVLRYLEDKIKKPKQEHLGYRKAREEAEAELARRKENEL